MSYTPGQAKSIKLTASIATVTHVLLFISFIAAGTYSATQNLQRDVTLSVFTNTQKPEEADFIAPHNQIGSGKLERNVELSTNQRSLVPDRNVNEIVLTPEQQQYSRPKAFEETAIVTTITTSPYYAIVDDNFELEQHEESIDDLSSRSIADLGLQIASLEAKLLDKTQLDTKKTKAKVITSTTALASQDAAYLHQWRDRIETVGNLHYPDAARQQSLYGDVRLLVKLQSTGLVEEIKVLASSGSSILDSAAIESVRLAAPFEPFYDALAAEYDRLDIIRTWQFRKNRVSAVAQPN